MVVHVSAAASMHEQRQNERVNLYLYIYLRGIRQAKGKTRTDMVLMRLCSTSATWSMLSWRANVSSCAISCKETGKTMGKPILQQSACCITVSSSALRVLSRLHEAPSVLGQPRDDQARHHDQRPLQTPRDGRIIRSRGNDALDGMGLDKGLMRVDFEML